MRMREACLAGIVVQDVQPLLRLMLDLTRTYVAHLVRSSPSALKRALSIDPYDAAAYDLEEAERERLPATGTAESVSTKFTDGHLRTAQMPKF